MDSLRQNHPYRGSVSELSNASRLLEQCGAAARVYLAELAIVQAETVKAIKPFDEGRVVRPVHCDDAVRAVKLLQGVLNSLASLLEKPTALSLRASPMGYRLLLTSHQAAEQAQEFIHLIGEFRPICLENIRQAGQCRQDIASIIELLKQTSEDLRAEGALLVNQIDGSAESGSVLIN